MMTEENTTIADELYGVEEFPPIRAEEVHFEGAFVGEEDNVLASLEQSVLALVQIAVDLVEGGRDQDSVEYIRQLKVPAIVALYLAMRAVRAEGVHSLSGEVFAHSAGPSPELAN